MRNLSAMPPARHSGMSRRPLKTAARLGVGGQASRSPSAACRYRAAQHQIVDDIADACAAKHHASLRRATRTLLASPGEHQHNQQRRRNAGVLITHRDFTLIAI